MSQQEQHQPSSFFDAVRKAYGFPEPSAEVVKSRRDTLLAANARARLQQSCISIIILVATAVALIGGLWCVAEIFSRWP